MRRFFKRAAGVNVILPKTSVHPANPMWKPFASKARQDANGGPASLLIVGPHHVTCRQVNGHTIGIEGHYVIARSPARSVCGDQHCHRRILVIVDMAETPLVFENGRIEAAFFAPLALWLIGRRLHLWPRRRSI